MILCHENVENPKISDKMLLDDTIIEVDEDGHILWRWSASEHIDEFGFSPVQRETIRKWPNYEPRSGCGDWLHINCVSWLGENPWYDQGDERFRPEIFSLQPGGLRYVHYLSRNRPRCVRLGPDFSENETLKAIGWIIGQHHVHMIPKGLPGQGNILLFDNGGAAGYGVPTPHNPTGNKAIHRDYSRILEINPVTLKVEWEYSAAQADISARWKDFAFIVSLSAAPSASPTEIH